VIIDNLTYKKTHTKYYLWLTTLSSVDYPDKIKKLKQRNLKKNKYCCMFYINLC